MSLQEIPIGIWLQIGASFVTTGIVIASIVWFFSQVKAGMETRYLKLDSKVDLIQNTVSPYGAEIDKNRAGLSDVRQRLSKVEVQTENLQRDIVRLEGRQDAASKRT